MDLRIEAKAPPLAADADGVMRVGGTRVTLDSVVHAFKEGHTAEEITSHYPVLRLADVYAVISYYLNNQAAVDAYLASQEQAAGEVWEQIEAMSSYRIFRERLRAARDKRTRR